MREALKPEMDAVRDAVFGDGHSSKQAKPRKRRRRRRDDPGVIAQAALRRLLEEGSALNPTADPPPVLTRHMCKGGPECTHASGRYVCACEWPEEQEPTAHTCLLADGHKLQVDEHGHIAMAVERCLTCELCEWEKDAQRWDYVRVGAKELRMQRQERKYPFNSLDEALAAFADWERHDRWGPSAMGPMIAKLEARQVGPSGQVKRDDPLLARAGDMVAVRSAVEGAYAADNVWRLSPLTCQVMLVARAAGVLPQQPRWDVMATVFAVPKATVKSVVIAGRRSVTIELTARGVIPLSERDAALRLEVSLRKRELGQ